MKEVTEKRKSLGGTFFWVKLGCEDIIVGNGARESFYIIGLARSVAHI
jgi:hypothetical protein